MVSIRPPVVNQAGNRDRAEVHWKLLAINSTAKNLLFGLMCMGWKMTGSKSGEKKE
jgi:hypothetical protein